MAKTPENILENNRKWREKNREKLRESYKQYYQANQEKRLASGKKYREANKEKYQKLWQKNAKERRQFLRLELLQLLGNKCAKCGFSDIRALQIDHTTGGGNEHRKLVGTQTKFYKEVTESFNLGENKFQLLCANCNAIKIYENKERPRLFDERCLSDCVSLSNLQEK